MQASGQEFQGDVTLESQIQRLEDHTHAACAQTLFHLVMKDDLALMGGVVWGRGHGGFSPR
jgi:hypothetical protein